MPKEPWSLLHVVLVLLPVEVVPGGVPLDPAPHLAARHALELPVLLSTDIVQVPVGVPVNENNICHICKSFIQILNNLKILSW